MTGTELKSRRENIPMSTVDFAKRLECDVETILSLESDQSTIPFSGVFALALQLLESETETNRILARAELELSAARKRRGLRISKAILSQKFRTLPDGL